MLDLFGDVDGLIEGELNGLRAGVRP